MKYCTRCGSPSEDNAAFCSNCGEKFGEQPPQPQYQQPQYQQPVYGAPYQQPYRQPAAPQKASDGKFIYGLIGFFIPLAGFILWLVLKGDREGDAKRAGRGAIISIVLAFILGIASFILMAVFGASVLESSGALEEFGEFFPMLFHLR